MNALLEISWVRFALSGTLILAYALADHWAGRARPMRRIAPPRWVRPLIVLSILAYYALIGPTGGPLLGGALNVAGVVLVIAAAVYRCVAPVRYPENAGRILFYLALPLAVGVPWGFLVLSVPACAASLVCAWRDERLGTPGGRYRLVPGLW